MLPLGQIPLAGDVASQRIGQRIVIPRAVKRQPAFAAAAEVVLKVRPHREAAHRAVVEMHFAAERVARGQSQ